MGGNEISEVTAGDQLPLLDDRHGCIELLDLVEVVGGIEDGGTVGGEPPDEFEQVASRRHVRTRRGLVEEQQRRAVEEGDCRVQPPLLSSGERARFAAEKIRDVERCGDQLDAVVQVPSAKPRDLTEEPHVVAYGDDRVDTGLLGSEPDPTTSLVRGGHDVDAVHHDRAGIGPAKPGDDRHQRRLPRSVRSEETDDLPGCNSQVDATERVHVAVGLDEASHAQHWRRG